MSDELAKAGQRKSSAAVYGTMSSASVDKAKRDRPKRSESSVSGTSKKRIGTASLRQGGVEDSNSSEETPKSAGRSSRRSSLRLSTSEDPLETVSREATVRIVPLITQQQALDGFNKPTPEQLDAVFSTPRDVATKYREFLSWSRRLNHSFGPLEFVLVGPAGSGKSSLVETLIGEPCCPVGSPTRRPVYFHLIDDPNATQSIKYTVRDSAGETVCTSSETAAAEIRKKNKRTFEPLVVQVEYAWGCELTLIDTPGIRTPEDLDIWRQTTTTSTAGSGSGATGGSSAAGAGSGAQQQAQRILVCVEPCPTSEKQLPAHTRVTDNLTVLPLLKRVDPTLSRTLTVLTQFDSFMDAFCAQPDTVESTLAAASALPGVVFMTLPTDEIRTSCARETPQYKTRVYQYETRDVNTLRSWFDLPTVASVIASRVGSSSLRSLVTATVRRYVAGLIPDLARALVDNVATLEQQLGALQQIRQEWTVENVRSFASQYATLYLRFLDALVSGSIQGQPHVRGQTLRDEELDAGLSWTGTTASTNTSSAPDASSTTVSPPLTARGNSSARVKENSSNSAAPPTLRLYGAPQLFRLLDDFRAYATKLDIPTVADTELSITSVDPAWTAAEIARSKVEQQFVPLMHQLLDRSYWVLKRTSAVADAVADEHILAGVAAKWQQQWRRERYSASTTAATAGAGARAAAALETATKAGSLSARRMLPRAQSSISSTVLASSEPLLAGSSAAAAVAAPSLAAAHLKAQPRRDSRLEPPSASANNSKVDAAAAAAVAEPTDLDILAEFVAASNLASLASIITLREFPAFASFLKQSYLFALNSLQRKCMQRCEDEFYGAHTMYWELTGGVDPLALAGMPISQRQTAVKSLVAKLYSEIKVRLIDGFVRNVQTYFLSTTSFNDLMKSVVADVSTMSESSVKEMFKMEAVTLALDRRITALSTRISGLKVAQSRFNNQVQPKLSN